MTNYIINPTGIASEHFEDEIIILNLPKGNYYSLRGTGQYIWAQLENGLSTSQILAALTSTYEVANEVAQPALQLFLEQLAQEDLIQETATITTTTPAVASTASGQPFVTPSLEIYTDMQDLLMLDPIHKSDPEKGWPYKN